MAKKNSRDIREAVHKRIRKNLSGSTERPRLAVFRSVNHIYAQLIDDATRTTIASASTTEPDLRGQSGGNIAAARQVGKLIAERAKEKGVTRVVFDRGGYIYHGRVRNLAEAAREAGLEF